MQRWDLASNILDCINEIIYVSDLEHNLLYVNSAVEQVTGWTVREALHKKCHHIFQNPFGKCTSDCPVYNKNTRGYYRFEKTVISNSGKTYQLQVSASPFFENRQMVDFIMVAQDIARLRYCQSISTKTKRQLQEELRRSEQLEKSLRRSEATYSAMFQYTGTAMLVVDEDKTVSMANRELENITGYSRADIVGKRKWDQFVHPDDREWMIGYHMERRKKDGQAPGRCEFRLIDARGKVRDIFYTVGMIPGTSRSVVSMLDITERKQMERALRESEEKYRELLENIEDVFYEVDLRGNFKFINDSVTRVFGFARKQLDGFNYREFTDPENAQKIYNIYNKIFSTGVPERGVALTIIRPDGEKRHLEVSASPTRNRDGNIIGFRGTARDITDRVRAEERLRYLSMHDALTGLYNRAYFEEEMQRLEKGRHFPISIICGDVDGLKTVNDTMGHKKGDELLVAAATSIKRSTRASDMAARVGGDEFVVILPDTGGEMAQKVARRIQDNMDDYNQKHPELLLSISLGWATAESVTGMVDLFKQADNKMYAEKIRKNMGRAPCLV